MTQATFRYDTYLIDLDGTIYPGDSLLPGVADTVKAIRPGGQHTIFLMNKGAGK